MGVCRKGVRVGLGGRWKHERDTRGVGQGVDKGTEWLIRGANVGGLEESIALHTPLAGLLSL
jgi:hypothetical protein